MTEKTLTDQDTQELNPAELEQAAGGEITKSGGGTNRFNGANTYTGTTTVNGGVVTVNG